jgi:hypothetical protein
LTASESIVFGGGNDINDRKPPKAAWKLVTKPKEEGGLGVIDIEK